MIFLSARDCAAFGVAVSEGPAPRAPRGIFGKRKRQSGMECLCTSRLVPGKAQPARRAEHVVSAEGAFQ